MHWHLKFTRQSRFACGKARTKHAQSTACTENKQSMWFGGKPPESVAACQKKSRMQGPSLNDVCSHVSGSLRSHRLYWLAAAAFSAAAAVTRACSASIQLTRLRVTTPVAPASTFTWPMMLPGKTLRFHRRGHCWGVEHARDPACIYGLPHSSSTNIWLKNSTQMIPFTFTF